MSKKILVTRPAHQAAPLCHLIEQQGWQAVRFPVIEILATELSRLDQQRIQILEQYQFLFFISANAVHFLLEKMQGKTEVLRATVCVAVGKATLNALSEQGVHKVLSPAAGFNSEAVLKIAELQQLQGQSCLIVRGKGGRELLAETLRARGAQVDYLEVYQRTIPKQETVQIAEDLLNESLAAIVIYSGDALNNLLIMLAKQELQQKMLAVPLIVISQRVQKIAQKMGFKKIIVAEQASDKAMINAILNGEECG
ncbi:MAG: uroporphyrinogen-III synthase [Methyloprofundus sp.]|nr:uroporphyrinogen-III synthase [Methyloprofundus sp.]